LYFQLAPSTLPTEGTGFGLLPTPKTMMPDESNPNVVNGRIVRKSGEDYGMNLQVMASTGLLPTPRTSDMNYPGQHGQGGQDLRTVIAGMLPTPTAMDSTNATATMKSTQVKEGSMHSVTLIRAMSMGMLPTPIASEGGELSGNEKENQMSMTKIVRQEHGKTSQLNPRFVLEMMGFPPNWTELPFQNGETNQSRPLATQ
jgi:hypothetical protein